MTTGRFHGAFTALVTPFKNGKIDEEAYREFIEWQIEQGIDGLVPCGTTGESATMTHDEHEAAIRICVEQVNKRVPVIAGAGSNNTREAIPLTQFAKNVGADAALHITPYYNKPTQEGLYQHFKTICSEVSMPVILYNVPGRTGCNMLPPTVARIARDVPDVVGIKEATADKDRFLEYRNPQGQIMYSAYTALPNGWIIVAAASKEAMLAGVRNLRSDIILSCVGALLLVTLLIYLILRKVTGVLQEGVEFAERVASGDLDRSLNIRREDELGKLARALNTMVQRLKASFSMAEERAREAEEASARATETSQELEAVINGVRGGVARLELTDNLRVLWANAGFYALAGRSHAEYEQDVHDEALLVVHPDDRAHLLGAFRSSLASNIPVHTEYRILRRDGGVVWIYLQASLVGHRDGVPVFQGVFVDVSKQKNTMRALELEQQRNRIVAELTNDIIFEYDYDTDEMTCSERYETIFHKPRVIPNYRRHQDNLLNMLLPEDAKTLQEAYRRIEQGVDSYALTLRLLQPEAGYQWYSIRFRSIRDETGRAIKLIGQLTNIHHQKLEEDRLRHEASTDLLTQIYNKITTEHLVSLELQEGRNHALIVVDLDKFKYANDTFGHLFGDSVIKAVAATLRATFRATDIVGRTGGDEFVVLAKDISLSDGLETLKATCRRLSVELAHVSLGQDYVISASIGISLFPRDGKTYAELFAKADAALYQIKNTGRGHFAVYGEVPETETKALPSGGKGMPLMPQGPRNDA